MYLLKWCWSLWRIAQGAKHFLNILLGLSSPIWSVTFCLFSISFLRNSKRHFTYKPKHNNSLSLIRKGTNTHTNKTPTLSLSVFLFFIYLFIFSFVLPFYFYYYSFYCLFYLLSYTISRCVWYCISVGSYCTSFFSL